MVLLRPNDLRHFLNLRPGKNARNKWHSDVGRARSDARPAAKMGCRVEILPEKYSRITTDTLVLQQRNIEADKTKRVYRAGQLGRRLI